jgi:D-alanyl-D-alanine carboxypeptidase
VGLPIGAEMTVDLALRALIVKSANDVAVMLAEGVAGSEQAFVEEMNATARRLGMTRTRFVNANGLPAAEQVTTARDLAKLARAIVTDFPEHAHYWSMPEVRIGNVRLRSHNGLLKTFDGADGLKTGFICDSGYNVVASATREGRRLMAVVLGEATGYDRTLRASSLLEYGFQQHGWKALFKSPSVDAMPLAPEAKGITSIRDTVISWECGTRRRAPRPAAQVRTVRAKAAAARAEAAAKAGTGQGSAPPAKAAVPKTSAAPPAGKTQ